jgi:cyclase
VGGGIRSVDTARQLLRAGADKISINTSAVEDPDLVSRCADAFGSQAVVVAIDARHGPARAPTPGRNDGWQVFTYGGRKATGLDVVEYAVDRVARGAGEILLTSMDQDGEKTGYDLALLDAVSSAVGVPVIASGGAGNAQHMIDAVKVGGADAVLAASIFHFGEVSIGEVKAAMAAAGVPVRPTELVPA